MDNTIVYIEIPELEALEIEDIQLVEDFEVDKTIPTIRRLADYKDEDLDMNLKNQNNKSKTMMINRHSNNSLL